VSGLTLTSDTVNANNADGVNGTDLGGTTTVSGGTYGTAGAGNPGYGLNLIGDFGVSTSLVLNNGVSASANAPAGLSALRSNSVSDTGGTYSTNNNDGIELADIGGDVTLTLTTANDNDADNNSAGDGLHAIAGVLDYAIGGNLLV